MDPYYSGDSTDAVGTDTGGGFFDSGVGGALSDVLSGGIYSLGSQAVRAGNLLLNGAVPGSIYPQSNYGNVPGYGAQYQARAPQSGLGSLLLILLVAWVFLK